MSLPLAATVARDNPRYLPAKRW